MSNSYFVVTFDESERPIIKRLTLDEFNSELDESSIPVERRTKQVTIDSIALTVHELFGDFIIIEADSDVDETFVTDSILPLIDKTFFD